MSSFKIVLFALPLLLSQILPSVASTVPRLPQIKRGEGVIKALLRAPSFSQGVGNPLSSRQTGSCRPGQHLCGDGQGGCCPNTYYCVTGGCCPNGEVCSGSSGQCADGGYFPCSNSNFCCPFGTTCGRDSCFESGPAPAPTTRTRTSTIHFTSTRTSTRVNTPPPATPKPTPNPPPPNPQTVKSETVVVTDVNNFDTSTETATLPNTRSTSTLRTQSTVAAQITASSGAESPLSSTPNGAPAMMGITTGFLVIAGIAVNIVAP